MDFILLMDLWASRYGPLVCTTSNVCSSSFMHFFLEVLDLVHFPCQTLYKPPLVSPTAISTINYNSLQASKQPPLYVNCLLGFWAFEHYSCYLGSLAHMHQQTSTQKESIRFISHGAKSYIMET